jgi:DNA primase
MFYSSELIEEIRAKNDIVEVISTYVNLKKQGANHTGLCPFHNEKTASFSVTGSRQLFFCFGCQIGGDVIKFIMEYENFSYVEALRFLAERAGLSLPEVDYSAEARQRANKRERMLEINKEAAKYYYYLLHGEKGEVAIKYLLERNLTEETIKKFALGYASVSSNELLLYLKSKGYDDASIREAGLASFTEKYGMSDFFWNRVMFPIMDINNRVIGFGGRVMGEGMPKYKNSPETMVFEKSRHLYGLNFARKSRKNHLILCEGYMDVIALHQAGFTQAVASLGTAFTAGQANLLRRYEQDILLAYDSDNAGEKAALEAIKVLKECGLVGRVLDLSPHKDPDEFIKNEGAEAFEGRLAVAQNSFFYEIAVLEKSFNQHDPQQKTDFHKEIAKKLCGFSGDVERANYLEAVCEKYKINPADMNKEVVSQAAKTGLAKPANQPRSGIADKAPTLDPARRAERALLVWLADEPELYQKIKHILTAEDFGTALYQKVATQFFADLAAGNLKPAVIYDLFEEEEEQREVAAIFSTQLDEYEQPNEREKAFNDILRTVKNNSFESAKEKLDFMQAKEWLRNIEDLKKNPIKI